MPLSSGVSTLVVSLGVYLIGVGLAVAGALGLAAAVELSAAFSAVLFVLGLALVVIVHERLGGPV